MLIEESGKPKAPSAEEVSCESLCVSIERFPQQSPSIQYYQNRPKKSVHKKKVPLSSSLNDSSLTLSSSSSTQPLDSMVVNLPRLKLMGSFSLPPPYPSDVPCAAHAPPNQTDVPHRTGKEDDQSGAYGGEEFAIVPGDVSVEPKPGTHIAL